MMKLFYCVTILCCFYLNSCKSNQRKPKKKKQIVVYSQLNDKKPYKSEEQNFDTLGQLMETIKYRQDGYIHTIEKTSYDSLGRRIFFTITGFRDKKSPASSSFYCYYDKNGLLEREIYTNNFRSVDTIVKLSFYDHEKKLIKTKTTVNRKESIYYSGINHYYYDHKKRLIKVLNYDLDEKQQQDYDSIIYKKDTKIILKFDYNGEINSKEVYLYDKGKISEIWKYRVGVFTDGVFYLDTEEFYTYDYLDSLYQKQTKHYSQPSFCGFGSKDKLYTNTYFYQ